MGFAKFYSCPLCGTDFHPFSVVETVVGDLDNNHVLVEITCPFDDSDVKRIKRNECSPEVIKDWQRILDTGF